MVNKVSIFKKSCSILAGGIILIGGIKGAIYSDIMKLSSKLNNIKFKDDEFIDDQPILNSVYPEFKFQLSNTSSINKKYRNNEFNYKVRNYIPTLSNDLVSYTFYDDYIEIDLMNDKRIYCSCYYNNDGSYRIVCNCKNNLNYVSDDRLYTVTYYFSSDGTLIDSIIYDGLFSENYDSLNDECNYTLKK